MRPFTLTQKQLKRTEVDTEPALVDPQRPRTRGECAGGPRPCPFVGCRYNLYLDVNPETGSVKFNFPDRDPEDMPPECSCALDVADEGPHTLEKVGELMNMTRERVRQLEVQAQGKTRTF